MSENQRKRRNPKKSAQARKRRKRQVRRRRITALLIMIIFFAIGFAGYYVVNALRGVKHESISKDNSSLGISNSTIKTLKGYSTYSKVTNIALFGKHQRSSDESGRSDAVMILSIDKASKKIKLISVMRDSYVAIDGHGNDKLTHAYAYGGPQLSVKTLNENFDLNIKNYVSVNFFDMEKIINALGGVEIDVKDYEVKEINKYIKEVADITGEEYTPVQNAGVQVLNGGQALSYSRIRYVGNGDFERTSRQRIVLQALLNKIKEGGVLKLPSNIAKLAPMVKTSLSSAEMMTMGLGLFISGTTNFETARLPVDGTFPDGGKMINGVWYLTFDKDANIDYLHKYIYKDESLPNS